MQAHGRTWWRRAAVVALCGAAVVHCSGAKAGNERNVRTGKARLSADPEPQPIPTAAQLAPAGPDAVGSGDGGVRLTGQDQVGVTTRQVATGKFEITANIEHDGHSATVEVLLGMAAAETTEVLAVAQGNAVKIRESIEKMRVSMQMHIEMDGQRQDKQQPSMVLPLEGQVVIGERQGDVWVRHLEAGAPTPEQAKMLDEPVPVTDMYPQEPVAVGHSWNLPSSAMRALSGGFLRDVQGHASATLRELVPCGAHTCGVVAFSGDMAGTVAGDTGFGTVKWQIAGECKHDLSSGADLSCQFSGPIEGQLQVGQGAQANVTGRLEFTAKESVQ